MVKTIQDMLREDRARTREETTLLHLSTIMSKLSMNLEEAMKFLDIPKQDYPRYRDALHATSKPA